MSQEASNAWTAIESLIDQIYSFQTVSPDLYMTVYNKIFKYMVNARPMEPSTLAHANQRDWENAQRVAGDVYHYIKSHLQDKIERIIDRAKDSGDEDVLQLYVNYWNQYKAMCGMLGGSSKLLSQQWVRYERHSGRTHAIEIGPMSQQLWERMFFQPLVSQVIDKFCNIIKSQRNHQTVDITLMEKFMEILNDHDFIETMSKLIGNNVTNFNVYKEVFEPRLVRDAEEFYQTHGIPYNETDSLLGYLERVNQYIDKEVERSESYLSESTKLLLIKTMEGVLIRDSQHIISDEIKILLANNKHQELTNLYRCIHRMPNTKIILIEVLRNHIQQIGIDAINSIRTMILKEPKIYVDTVFAVYNEWLKLIEEIFDNDLELIATLKKACQYLINNDSLIKSVEVLVRYCDTLLRRSSQKMNDIEFEEKCHQIIFVFDLINDKDIFEKLYGKMLAKRLINQLSYSDDHEELLVTKLKQLCGQGYTSKLERMMQDIKISHTINQEYQTDCRNRQEKVPIEFSVMILSSNSWSSSLPSNILLSNELNIIFENFLQFYRQRHTGRKLTHLYHYSKGELQAYFPSKKYIFEVSFYQMILLLLFNQSLTWTIEQIFAETQMKIELLIETVNDLIKSNVLFCSQLNNEDLIETDLHIKYPIQLAIDFKSEKTRMNFNLPMKLSKEKESKNLQRTITDDRKSIIQTSIVRIMKEEKILKYSLLIQRVIEQINTRFVANIPLIKKSIDTLIEKEYLRRQSNDKDVLEYLP